MKTKLYKWKNLRGIAFFLAIMIAFLSMVIFPAVSANAADRKGQMGNPVLPSWEYVPDCEPHVFNGRLYLFGSHDEFNGKNFCQNDYILWSAPLNDLSDWKNEGIIYRTEQDPHAIKNVSFMQAPDVVQGPDGRYYLYYTLALDPTMSVAVSDKITGPYQYYGRVKNKNGREIGLIPGDHYMFDPGVFRDDDGRIFLYSGFSPAGAAADLVKAYQMRGGYVMELENDMLTIKAGPRCEIPGEAYDKGTGYEGHGFYEASSMRKINGKYYWIYSSVQSQELCYAVSDYPDHDFHYGGVLINIGNIGYKGRTENDNYTGNTHGSLVNVNGQWYIFYHRQTNGHMYSRQACAERITILPDGTIPQVQATTQGLNNGPLDASGIFPAGAACSLVSPNGAFQYSATKLRSQVIRENPYITQSGKDREKDPDQYIANFYDGCNAGFRYFNIKPGTKIRIETSGNQDPQGWMEIRIISGGKSQSVKIAIPRSEQRVWSEFVSIPAAQNAEIRVIWHGSSPVNFTRMQFLGK